MQDAPDSIADIVAPPPAGDTDDGDTDDDDAQDNVSDDYSD